MKPLALWSQLLKCATNVIELLHGRKNLCSGIVPELFYLNLPLEQPSVEKFNLAVHTCINYRSELLIVVYLSESNSTELLNV